MVEYVNGIADKDKDKVISLKSRRIRKKHKKAFDFLNKVLNIFHKGTGNPTVGKNNYKKTISH
jgi:hypothetical protein